MFYVVILTPQLRFVNPFLKFCMEKSFNHACFRERAMENALDNLSQIAQTGIDKEDTSMSFMGKELEDIIVTLPFADGFSMECGVAASFEVAGKQYFAANYLKK